jgi:hypothetical protein
MLRRRISPARGGGYAVRLPAGERELLQSLPEQLEEVLAAVENFAGGSSGDDEGAGAAGAGARDISATDTDVRNTSSAGPAAGLEDPGALRSLRRLFPPAYSTDEDAQRNYESLTRTELSAHHRRALATLSRTALATSIDDEELNEWLTAVNDLRLVLGTVLGVTEDQPASSSGASSQMVVYIYLSQLEAELVDVLELSLPDPVPGADDQAPDDPWGEPLGGLRWDGTPLPGDDF